MKSFSVLLICLFVGTFSSLQSALAACEPVADSCPFGVAEQDPLGPTPLMCSGKGACVNGACSCDPGYADVDCSAVARRTKLASAYISQDGFNDGPRRYFDIIGDIVEDLRQGTINIPPQEVATGCSVFLITPPTPLSTTSITLLENSVKMQVINGGMKASGAIHMIIPHVPIDAALARIPEVFSCCIEGTTDPKQVSDTFCAVGCASSTGDHVKFNMDVHFSVNIYPTFHPNGTVTMRVPPEELVVTFDPPDMNIEVSCGLSFLPLNILNFIDNFVISIGEIVAGRILDKALAAAERVSNTFSAAGIRVNVTENVAVYIYVPYGEFVENSHMAVEVEAEVRRERFAGQEDCTEVTTTFIDRTLSGSNIPPPNMLRNYFNDVDNDGFMRTFLGARVSRSIVRTVLAALFQDDVQLLDRFTRIRSEFGLLDANFKLAVDLNTPEIGFPPKSSQASLGNGDFVEAALTGGSVGLSCNETSESLFGASFDYFSIGMRPILIGELEDYEAAYFGSAEANFKMTLQVFDLDLTNLNLSLSAPLNISLPNGLATGLANTFLGDSKMEAANEMLKDVAFEMPQELEQRAPGPRLETLHDATRPGTDKRNGFLQLSTRCLCKPPAQPEGEEDFFFVVDTVKYGSEVVPRCINPCLPIQNGRRRLEKDVVEYKVTPASEYFARVKAEEAARKLEEISRRYLQTTGDNETDSDTRNITDFLDSGKCGSSLQNLKAATATIFTCAQRTDSDATTPLVTKSSCMLEVAPHQGIDELGTVSACAESNEIFNAVRECEAPARILLRDLFGQECIEGRAFDCETSLANIMGETCTCHDNPGSPKCADKLIPFLLLGAGWGVPLGFVLIMVILMRSFENCCVSRLVGSEQEMAVSLFRVQLSKQDKYFMGLCSAAFIALAATSVGWVVDDPVRHFVQAMLSQDVFRHTQWVTTDFDNFAVNWSLAIIFALSFAGASLFAMFLYSLLVGRCTWLAIAGSQAYQRGDGEWFVPSEHTAGVWSRNALRLQWLNRIAALLLIMTLFAPPIFFPVRKSVRVGPPQFDPFTDLSNVNPDEESALTDLTSIATSENLLGIFGMVLGLTLMSSFLGFVASIFLLVILGAVPAAFSTASVALYWIDAQQRRAKDEFELVKHFNSQNSGTVPILSEDISDKNRWKRVLHFFIWCAHGGGAIGTLVGAIIIYQTIRAPPAWAFVWIFLWIVTIPFVVMLSNSKAVPGTGRRTLIVTILYCGTFIIATVILVSLAPSKIAFSSPMAVVFFIAMYLYFFTILISEYCNLGAKSTAVAMGGGRVADQDSTITTRTNNGFEVGYSFNAMPGGINKQVDPPRIKSVMLGRSQPGAQRHGANRFLPRGLDLEERDYEDTNDGPSAYNPAFAGAQSVEGINRNKMSLIPPRFSGRASTERDWVPPVGLPFMNTIPGAGFNVSSAMQSNGRFLDQSTVRRAADRVSMRHGGVVQKQSALPPRARDMRSHISRRLQSRGLDPSLQDDMADRITAYALQNQHKLSQNYNSSLTPYGSSSPRQGGGRAREMVRGAVDRTRQSVRHWGERLDYVPKDNGEKDRCDNPVLNVLLERKERRENTYGVRVVPLRRLFFFVGVVMLATVMFEASTDPATVDGLKSGIFNVLMTIIQSRAKPGSAPLNEAVEYDTFDQITAPLDPPIAAYISLSQIGFYLLWVVLGLFTLSFVLEIYYSRFGSSNVEHKRRGIRFSRMVAFSSLPFLLVAVVIPSSADYVLIAFNGIATAPICAENFDALVFTTISNLFGLAMGAILAVQTMLVVLLIVPAVIRALSFVIAKEVFDLSQVAENSKAFIAGEKRVKIARYLFRCIPYLSPILLYVPTALIAQGVANEYSSVLVYVFYLSPIITARFRTANSSKGQKPYRWVIFSSVWTTFYFVPLIVILVVEIIELQSTVVTKLLLTNPMFYVTILAEVCLAIVVLSDVLYLFISSDEDADADLAIDQFMDALQEEAESDTPQSNPRFENIHV